MCATKADPASPEDVLRLDKWLVYARFCKTRGVAGDLIEGGDLRIDGTPVAKPHFLVRPGMVLTFAYGGHVRVIRVAGIPTRRGPPAEAQRYYEDLDPPSDANRLTPRVTDGPLPAPSREKGMGRPTKRDRRKLDRLSDPFDP